MPVSNGSIFTEDCADITISDESYKVEDCADISDWNDLDNGTNAESTQVTFDSKECFKLDSGDAAVGNYAYRSVDVGSFGNNITYSFSVYHSALGAVGDVDYFTTVLRKHNCMLQAGFATDGLFVHDGAAWNEVGTDVVQTGVWQEWKFEVKFISPQICDVYLDGVLVATDVDCSRTGGFQDGLTQLLQYGYASANRIAYIDWLKIGDTYWIDNDYRITGTAESTGVTFDGKSCFKFDSGSSGVSHRAIRTRDVGSFGNRTTVSFSLYHSALGTLADTDYFVMDLRRSGVKCHLAFATDGLFIYDGAASNEVGTNEVSTGAWQDWTLDIDFTTPASATVDVYKGDTLVGSSVDCSYTGVFTEGEIELIQHGYTTANRITYLDWLEVGDDLSADVSADPGPVGLTTSLTGEAAAEGNTDVDPGPILLTALPVGTSPENDPITLVTSLEGVVLSAHIDCDAIPLTTSLTGYRLECDPIEVTLSVEGQSAGITIFPDPIEVVISLTGDYSEFITMTPIEVTLGLTGGYAHEYVVIANPIEVGATLTADWPNVLVSPDPISLTTRLLGEGVVTDKAEIILYFYSNGQLITTKTISLTSAIAGQEWLRTRFPVELKGRHLSIKVECTGANRETYLYDYGLDLRILNER